VKALVEIVQEILADFIDDDAMALGAAIAFYTALSFAPLLVLLSWGASFLGAEVQDALVENIMLVLGGEAAMVADRVLHHAATDEGAADRAGALGLVTLLVSATAVFAQLQAAMNRVWNVRARTAFGIADWLRKRLLSLGMVLTILFLLLVSLVVTAILQMLLTRGEGALWVALNLALSLAVTFLLFASIFKVLPDVEIAWTDVWLGAAITACLFSVGKWAIGVYLGRADPGASYGAAGSLVVLLVWVYYSSLILFVGAETTQVVSRRMGSEIRPDAHAEWIPGSEPGAGRRGVRPASPA
jgi:membrane protein